MHSSNILALMVDAFEAYLKDRDSKAFAETLKTALVEHEKILSEAHKAEHEKWDTMFMHVRLMENRSESPEVSPKED